MTIESWESSSASDAAHASTEWAARHLRGLALAAVVLALALASTSLHDGARLCLFLASAVSALLLFWLARARRQLTAMQLRVAADAALLTPLLFAAWMR